ncbi:MAG: uroporphyrinogen decarboxylase [Alphaproteobacteria bacterium]|jgi:uroporphyrinogen decarboxylase|nr:uroporphyrinogen decarboxylase [Alphaproteobacteria bacterium]MBU2042312.1 uroporphyrinogen decarboxylase [Alphaproteobacteria bacterium]MBU2124786.1 uroporphyrinogen decarboxylase [Alphaproteobacteria bacterium]MBU2207463.1 uroporphyrinogen decarboxylase [Alphaproteobacteria bacterium]MBU2292365.1 uroporphyrinogen decarboxylase [Alphaproteobacteria bacterium]
MTLSPDTPLLLKVLAGEATARPPVWFMRQAGRYLPEYRALRATTPDFISFCLDPEKAAEATLQPMRRFGFDAAIVFADILLIPRALGQEVWFEAGEGPRLGALPPVATMEALTGAAGEALKQVGETLSLVRGQLDPGRALIGFAGAPWTVATYMLDGESRSIGKGERAQARTYAYAEPEEVAALLDVLVEATAHYLKMQADAGAQVLKIFESWAEGLPEDLFESLVLRPHQKLVRRVRELGVTVPLIGFPRGSAALAERYAAEVDVQAVALDTACPLDIGRRVQAIKPIQGALDPLLLRAGGPMLDRRVDQLLEAWGQGPWIFNLGHGILPDVPIAHVEQVLKRIGAQ